MNRTAALDRDRAAPIIARLHSESHDSNGITAPRDHQRLFQQNLPGADIAQRACLPIKVRQRRGRWWRARRVRPDGTEMAFDLRKFPPGQRERFVTSVTRGKNQMPQWGQLLQAGPARCAVGLRVSWGEKLIQA
jgi:hypothetical protein